MWKNYQIPSEGRDICLQAESTFERGDFPAARSFYEQALAIYESALSKPHPETARCLNGLAKTLDRLGDYPAAQAHAEHALTIRLHALGMEHPDTAESLHTLGEIRNNQGDLKSGEEYTGQALKIRELTLGTQHPDTVESMKSLALMLEYRGDHIQAQNLLEQALDICENTFGEFHPATARVLNGLGLLWAKEETTHLQALRMYERAQAINEKVYGPDHPYSALGLNNQAALLADMGDLHAAAALLEESLKRHEQIFGAKNPRLAFVLINLADTYKNQKDFVAARPLYERALVVSEQAMGAQHPLTLRSLKKLVGILALLGQQGDQQAKNEAMPLYTLLNAMEADAGTLPPEKKNMPGAHQDPAQAARLLHEHVARLEVELSRPALSDADQAELQTAQQLRSQADHFFERGDYASAKLLLEQALAIQERVLGENHLDHVELLKKLAGVNEKLGQPSAVLPLLERVVDIHIQVLGYGHPNTLLAMSNLQFRYDYEYGPAKSLPLLEQIHKIQEETLGPDDPNVKMSRETLSRIKASVEKRKGSEIIPQRSRSQKREDALKSLPQDRLALLAGIDEIPWHDLNHAYGPADDVPDLLRMLLADDQSVRDDAWERLFGNIWHQGDIYEASAYAVPFLLRMLSYDGPPEKEELLNLLSALADGHSMLEGQLQSEADRTRWREILAKQGRDLESELIKARKAVEAMNNALAEGIPIYLEFLIHGDLESQRMALDLLANLSSKNAQIVPQLQAILPSIQDAGFRLAVTRTIRKLKDDRANA